MEKVQHEILEAPVTVYNFQVEDYHTYYVADSGMLVHNSCNHNSAWAAERAAYWKSESFLYPESEIKGQLSTSGTYRVTKDNVRLMSLGKAPFGTDGKKVQLHHPYGIGADFYYYYEVTATYHQTHFAELHSYLYE